MVTKYRGNLLVTKHRKTVLNMDILWFREVKHYKVLEYSVVKVIGLTINDRSGIS